MSAFEHINGGTFQFIDSDMVLCYYPAGFQFFTLNATKTSLIAYTDTLPDFVASSVLVTDENANPVWDGPLTNGQIIIGSTGAKPVAAALTAGSNVTITNSAGGISIAATGAAGAVLLAPAANQVITGPYTLQANNLVSGYTTTATAAGTTVLTVGSTQQQYFTGVTTQTVTLPVTSTLVLGLNFEIVNNSTGVVTVNSSGGNLIVAMQAQTQLVVTCILTSGTSAASWDTDYTADIVPVPLAVGGTNAALTATNNALVVGTATAMDFLSSGANGVLVSSNANVPAWLANSGTAGFVLTANAGAPPSWQVAAAGSTWVDQTTASVTMAVNTGYTANAGASLITFTLPAASAIGDYVEINGLAAGLWIIAQAAGQQIQVAPNATTAGVGGSLASINQYDCVRLRCVVANTVWAVVSQQSTGLTRV
jgi:hypothetical protein